MKQRLENKLFNGYVRNPIPMVLFAMVVGVALLTLAVWATIDSFRPVQIKSLITEEVFVKYTCDGPIFVVSAASGQTYDLPTDAITDSGLLDDLVKNKTSVFVEYLLPINPESISRDALAISSANGVSIVSKDTVTKVRQQDTNASLCVLWTFFFLYLFFVLFSYYFVSRAPKYPRISSLLIRASYRNF